MVKHLRKTLIHILSLSLISAMLFAGRVWAGNYDIPTINSFSVSNSNIDLSSLNPELEFTLRVSHPIGINSTKVYLWFKGRDGVAQIGTNLIRLESEKVNNFIFFGKLLLPSNLPTGIYDFYAEPVEGVTGVSGLGNPRTGNIYPTDFNRFLNAEKSVLVRLAGELNLSSKTFVGPTYKSYINLSDGKNILNLGLEPIFRVNEYYDPQDYFNLRVPELKLNINSSTPEVCIKIQDRLKFITTGNCIFTIFTERNKDYLSTSLTLSSEISPARQKPIIILPSIPPQTSDNLPKKIDLGIVYSSFAELIVSKTITPEICTTTGISEVIITSGGTCTLTYKSLESKNYLSSDLYKLSFEVSRATQNISFSPPAVVSLSSKTLALSATASSSGDITFETKPAEVCSITNSTLILLKSGNCSITATQAGTSTLAPISATSTVTITGSLAPVSKTITCVMGKKSKKVSGANPNCPKGYKLKK